MGTRRIIIAVAVASMMWMTGEPSAQAAPVIKENGRTFIVDQRGERWDVTQAESLGFEPEGFQFGIGRDAFAPLDDSRVTAKTADVPGDLRVIGTGDSGISRAYSVPRLKGHEIANSSLGGKAVAAAY
jgi:hypothetical protein